MSLAHRVRSERFCQVEPCKSQLVNSRPALLAASPSSLGDVGASRRRGVRPRASPRRRREDGLPKQRGSCAVGSTRELEGARVRRSFSGSRARAALASLDKARAQRDTLLNSLQTPVSSYRNRVHLPPHTTHAVALSSILRTGPSGGRAASAEGRSALRSHDEQVRTWTLAMRPSESEQRSVAAEECRVSRGAQRERDEDKERATHPIGGRSRTRHAARWRAGRAPCTPGTRPRAPRTPGQAPRRAGAPPPGRSWRAGRATPKRGGGARDRGARGLRAGERA